MFKPDTNTYNYFKSDTKMMLEKSEPWEKDPNDGKGDALLRTARAYMAYGDKELFEGIKSCFKLEADGHYQAYRCYPDYGAEDVSRDQTIGALSSFLMRGDISTFKEIGPKLRFRLSKRYIQGPGMWIWIRQWWTLYGIIEFFSIIFGILWNKILYKLMGRTKVYDEEYYMRKENTGVWSKNEQGKWVFIEDAYWVTNGNKLYALYQKKKDEKWWFRFLDSTEYPTYGAMLTAYLVYCMPNSLMKKILVKLLLWNVKNDNNLLFRAMFKHDVTKEEVDKLKPMKWFRWTTRFDGSCYFDYLEKDDAIYNTIDKDILYFYIK